MSGVRTRRELPVLERLPIGCRCAPDREEPASCSYALAYVRMASASPSPRSRSAVARASATSTVAIAFGVGPDALRRLRTLGARLRGDALPFRLHARQDRLGVLLRQVGTADPHILDRHAEPPHLDIHLIADRRHDLLALRRQHVQQLVVRQHAAQRGRDDRIEPAADAVLQRADGLIVKQRIVRCGTA